MIRTPEEYHAFIPAPLPPAIRYDAELALALSRADAALSELSGFGRLLPNPHLLIAPCIRREAVLSSRIEGTRASLSDILLDEMKAEVPDGDETDVREVRNYVAALEHGVKRLRTLPLSLRLVRELHARLMKGVRGDRATPPPNGWATVAHPGLATGWTLSEAGKRSDEVSPTERARMVSPRPGGNRGRGVKSSPLARLTQNKTSPRRKPRSGSFWT